MTEGFSSSDERDKWERRRAERRAQPVPAAAPVLERPANLNRAFVLWLVIGAVTAVALVGIVVVFAAFNLRAGYRGARVLLTVFGAGSFLSPFVVLAVMIGAGRFSVLSLVWLLSSAVVIAAVILMWRPEVSAYFATLRSRPERR
jgi:lipopolysaccharide export LptBFGC system permease protein LptF